MKRLAIVVCAALAALRASAAGAQERLVGGSAWAAAPVYQRWSFGTPAALDSLRVRGASQLTLPVSVRVPLGARWNLDATTAYATGTADVTRADGSQETRRLDGPADVRLRATGNLVGDGVLLTAGLNVPTGRVRLDAPQLQALRVLGAPALGFRTPTLGSGVGGTLGLVLAREMGGWAWALGTAYEQRGTYTPVEASIAGVRAPTDLTPGGTVHLLLGGDGLVGEHRMSLSVAGDLYARDRIRLPGAGGASGSAADETSYRLGPTLAATWRLQIASRRVHDLTLTVVDRYRSAFTDADGVSVAGSSGNYLDASLGGMLGGVRRAGGRGAGVVFGLSARHQTGLSIDNSITTAGVTSGGVLLGLALPAGRSLLQPYVQAQLGRLDTGAGTTSATGLAFGLTLGSR
jgi:hypothetical protein